MAKNNNKTESTKTSKQSTVKEETKKSQVTTQPKAKKEEKENIPVIAAETVETPTVSKAAQKKETVLKTMSPDAKVQLATLMQKRFIDNADAPIKYGQKFIDEMDNLIDATAMMAVLDLREEAIARGVDVNLTFNGTKTFQVTEACRLLGITLPKPKLLPDGQQQLNFKEATVDPKLQESIENEKQVRKAIEEKIPELDPSKITTDDKIKAALEYQMRSTPNVLKSLINAIEWLRTLRNFKAQTAEEKLKLEDRSIGEWITEILDLIKPTLILTGIGRAVYVNASLDGTPLSAHCTVRKNVVDEDGRMILNEVQIAEVVKTLLKANAKFTLSKEPEKMKDKTINDDRALQALLSGSEELIDTIMARKEDRDKKVYSMVLKQYYPNMGENMEAKMRNRIGQLMNLYLPENEKLSAYTDIMDEQEFPEKKEETTEKKN